jgi:hypothetical protein
LYHAIHYKEKSRELSKKCAFSDLGSTAVVDSGALKRFTYGKSILKESLRMFPVSVGVGRVLPVEAVFSGYRVPAGTVVVTQNQVSFFHFKKSTILVLEGFGLMTHKHQSPQAETAPLDYAARAGSSCPGSVDTNKKIFYATNKDV